MRHFIYDDVDRIDLGDGDWVDVKCQMSYGDQQRLVASFAQLKSRTSNMPDIDIDLETGNITLLLINVKAWNLKDAQGGIALINETTIKQLSIATADKLLTEINKRNLFPKV